MLLTTHGPRSTGACIPDENTLTPDGDFAKWRGAEAAKFAGKPPAGHPRQARVSAFWDTANLYVAFDIRSSKLQANVHEHDGDKLWEDDGVKFLIDALCHAGEFRPDDFSYHINSQHGLR
jgi:Carbohydrate family 9 binding domain-like